MQKFTTVEVVFEHHLNGSLYKLRLLKYIIKILIGYIYKLILRLFFLSERKNEYKNIFSPNPKSLLVDTSVLVKYYFTYSRMWKMIILSLLPCFMVVISQCLINAGL